MYVYFEENLIVSKFLFNKNIHVQMYVCFERVVVVVITW